MLTPIEMDAQERQLSMIAAKVRGLRGSVAVTQKSAGLSRSVTSTLREHVDVMDKILSGISAIKRNRGDFERARAEHERLFSVPNRSVN